MMVHICLNQGAGSAKNKKNEKVDELSSFQKRITHNLPRLPAALDVDWLWPILDLPL